MESILNNEHDKTYKVFLEDKHTFLEFLKGFVHEDWVNEIDEKNLSLVNKSFILKDYKEREADIIYKAKIGSEEIYFYILLELQSSVDYTMPYRLLIYMVELWRRHFENQEEKVRERKDFKLPAIIPMILYNGEAKWTAAKSFAEYQSGEKYFKNHLLDFRYIFFDVKEYNPRELEEIGSLIAKVFLFERSLESKDKFLEQFMRIMGSGQSLTAEQWIKLKRWILSIVIKKIPKEERKEVAKTVEKIEPTEVEKMVSVLERKLEKWEYEAEARGLQRGLQEGLLKAARVFIKEGKTLEEVTRLLDLPDEVVRKLKEERIDLQ